MLYQLHTPDTLLLSMDVGINIHDVNYRVHAYKNAIDDDFPCLRYFIVSIMKLLHFDPLFSIIYIHLNLCVYLKFVHSL